jgi:hypothetical protein
VTKKPPQSEALRWLLDALKARGVNVEEFRINKDGEMVSIPSTDNKNPQRIIHEYVDLELVRALQQWFESQDLSVLQVLSCLAFALATELYQESDSEAEACAISSDYETYIHRSVHGLWETYGAPGSRNKKT